ncbi:MAG: hypothetical protein IPP79_20765 [Chitinophagaceae bacterium]|nr:hypothetical protein [Chitinophagaceae bacterium]
MKVHLTREILQTLEPLFKVDSFNFLNGNSTGTLRLFKLLNSLPIRIEQDDDLINLLRETAGNANPVSYELQILRTALKGTRLLKPNQDLESTYVLAIKDNTAAQLLKKGIISLGPSFSGKDFYNNSTYTDIQIDTDWIKTNSFPPANSLLLLDHYCFGNPFSKKIEALTCFITNLTQSITVDFHLTIIFSSEKNSKPTCTPQRMDEAFELLSHIKNCKVQLICNNSLDHHDRIFYTNYTKGSFGRGVPWKNVSTRFNQQFLGSGEDEIQIRNNYFAYKQELGRWNNYIESIPEEIGLVKMRWEEPGFRNRIFTPVIDVT